MIFKRIKSDGLAHNSYFICSEDEAAVIDPRRDCEGYIDLAKREEVKIKQRLDSGKDVLVLDVRDDNEWKEGHIKGALHIYAGQLESRLSEIPRDRPITIVCNVGHRASLAASILLRAGYPNVCCDVLGSTKAWRVSKYPIIEEYI